MALSSAAQTVTQSKPGPRCGFGVILKNLSDEDRAYYEQMVAQGATRSHIASVFKADGYDISEFTVNRHENGKCACR